MIGRLARIGTWQYRMPSPHGIKHPKGKTIMPSPAPVPFSSPVATTHLRSPDDEEKARCGRPEASGHIWLPQAWVSDGRSTTRRSHPRCNSAARCLHQDRARFSASLGFRACPHPLTDGRQPRQSRAAPRKLALGPWLRRFEIGVVQPSKVSQEAE